MDVANNSALGEGIEFERVDIFLSYNHDDDTETGKASDLLARLTAAGYKVWIDKGIQGGENWQQAIHINLMRCSLVVALWSKRSVQSDWCKFEAITAAGNNKLFPVLLEPLAREDISNAVHDATAHINRVSHDAADLLDQIGARVTASRADAERRRQASARSVLAGEKVHLATVLSTGQPDLFGRESEETLLLQAWASCAPNADPAAKTNLVVLHAIGGAGKTALLRRMVDRLGETDFPHAAKVIGWSAYSQGSGENRNADADTFIQEALALTSFTGALPGDAVARARLLAARLREVRTLLLLDGIEPLQSLPEVDKGRLKDKGLARLLIELARENPGLVVVTSRQPLPEVEHLVAPKVRNHALAYLSPAAGAMLLKGLGCWGKRADLETASREADGHALTLTALGGYIDAVEGGDIRKRDHFRLGDIAFTAEEMAAPDPTVKAAKKAAKVMQGYIDRFASLGAASRGEGAAETMLLNIIGLFDRPADSAAVMALLGGEPIPGLTEIMVDWSSQKRVARINAAKSRLRTLKLLAEADPIDPNGLDAHPIVRAHFGADLKTKNPAAFRAAHERLFRHYAHVARDLPNTLEEMTPLFHAIGHGCAAGLYMKAWAEVYMLRMRRGGEAYLNRKLNAYGANLGALAHFFTTPWGEPAAQLSESAKAAALNYAASALRALGRLAEAEAAMAASLPMSVAQRHWINAATDADSVSSLRLSLGRVDGAVEAGREAVAHADHSGDAFQMLAIRTTLADALHYAGRLAEAETVFREAEVRQAKFQPERPKLYALAGHFYCNLLMTQGRPLNVRARAAYGLEVSVRNNWLAFMGLDTLADARALALLAEHGRPLPADLRAQYDAGIAFLRRAMQDPYIVEGLLSRAAFFRQIGEHRAAGDDLDEMRDIAERGNMKLILTDWRLESARLCLAQIPGAPPLTPTPLVNEAQMAAQAKKKRGLFGDMFASKPKPPPKKRPASQPARRATPLSAEERRLFKAAEEHVAEAARLVSETGYHRCDRELADLRSRLDVLLRVS